MRTGADQLHCETGIALRKRLPLRLNNDSNALMAGIDYLLEGKGIFVVEAPYLADLVEKIEYDTIYHQHLSYFAITPLQKFFARFGMELFDVVRTHIHGGSVRMFIARA